MFRRLALSTALKTIQSGGKNLPGLLAELEVEEGPRSLNACDRLYLPQILKDFPDFDRDLAKTYIKEHLLKTYSEKAGFAVHSIAIARYLPSRLTKTIVFQAAVCWKEQGKLLQRRLDVNYTYLLPDGTGTVAANCPNCAGALGFGDTQCPYCGCYVTSALGESWKVTNITES